MKKGIIFIIIGIVIILISFLFSYFQKQSLLNFDCTGLNEVECFQTGEGVAALSSSTLQFFNFLSLIGIIILIIGIVLLVKSKKKRK